jgi:hypothetical protein
MNIFKEKFILIEEIWYDEEPKKKPNIDILHYIERSQPIQGIQLDEFHTMVLDLTQDREKLWHNLRKNNRYKIKRAEQKDPVLYSYWDRERINDNVLSSFLDFHDRFSESQGLKKIPKARIKSFANAGILDLSLVKSQDGNPLVWHAHCCVRDRVCFFYGASIKNPNDTAYQSMLGRANRYHHWQDILRFKDSGISLYDFGGWYAGNTDTKLINVNKFKEEFGGEIIKNFRGFQGITLKGKLCISLYKLLTSSSRK